MDRDGEIDNIGIYHISQGEATEELLVILGDTEALDMTDAVDILGRVF